MRETEGAKEGRGGRAAVEGCGDAGAGVLVGAGEEGEEEVEDEARMLVGQHTRAPAGLCLRSIQDLVVEARQPVLVPLLLPLEAVPEALPEPPPLVST